MASLAGHKKCKLLRYYGGGGGGGDGVEESAWDFLVHQGVPVLAIEL